MSSERSKGVKVTDVVGIPSDPHEAIPLPEGADSRSPARGKRRVVIAPPEPSQPSGRYEDQNTAGITMDLLLRQDGHGAEIPRLAGQHGEHGNEHGQGGEQGGASQDGDRLNGRLADLSAMLDKLLGTSDEMDRRVTEIKGDIADLTTMVSELAGSGGGQSPGATFRPVAQLSVIEDDALAVAEDDDTFFKRLQKMFRGIWKLLWRLLSRVTQVKEWSLSGEVGPVPFMGKVGLSVTFGR
jgi:hypothetical protein